MGDKMRTNLRELERKTKVFWHGAPVGAMPYSWHVYDAAPDGELLVLNRSTRKTLYLDTLPREFFNHELLECNTRMGDGSFDAEELSRFVSKWGVPLLPERWLRWRQSARRFFNDSENDKAIDLTDSFGGLPDPNAAYHDKSGVSIAEVALAIEQLQGAVLILHDAIREWDGLDKHDTHTSTSLALLVVMQSVSYASCPSLEISLAESDDVAQARGLTGAICNQIIEAIADNDAPWRECAAPDCGLVFKYQHGNPRTRKNPNAEYCSAKCRERHKKQRQRAAKREANGEARDKRG